MANQNQTQQNHVQQQTQVSQSSGTQNPQTAQGLPQVLPVKVTASLSEYVRRDTGEAAYGVRFKMENVFKVLDANMTLGLQCENIAVRDRNGKVQINNYGGEVTRQSVPRFISAFRYAIKCELYKRFMGGEKNPTKELTGAVLLTYMKGNAEAKYIQIGVTDSATSNSVRFVLTDSDTENLYNVEAANFLSVTSPETLEKKA